jgi:hypothetical protein
METYNITFTSEVWYDLWRLTIPDYCDECEPEDFTIKGVLNDDNGEYQSDWDNVLEFLLEQGLCEIFGTLPIECYASYANINLFYTDWQGSEQVAFNIVADLAKELGVDIDAGCMSDIAYNIITGGFDNAYREEEYGWAYNPDSREWAYWENFTEPDTEAIRQIALADIQDIKNSEENEESS